MADAKKIDSSQLLGFDKAGAPIWSVAVNDDTANAQVDKPSGVSKMTGTSKMTGAVKVDTTDKA